MPASSGFFGQTVETLDTGVAVYDADGRIVYANPAYAAILSADRGDVEGRAVWEVDASLSRESFEDHWESVAVGETTVRKTTHTAGDVAVDVAVTTTCDVLDGERRHVMEVARSDHGTGMIRSETDRGADVEYQRSLLKAQQEATIDGILVVGENDEIVSYNRRFAEMWGVSERLIDMKDDEPVLDRVVAQVEHPDEFRERVEYLYDHPEEDSRSLIEVRDGRVIDRYTTAVVDDGTYYGRLWVFRDITDRIERQKRLERQNRRLDRFASVVSHDLRNPLNVAQGHLDLIAEDCTNEHLPPTRRALARMETIIDDVLALTREGRSVEDREPVPLATVARQAWDTVAGADATLHIDAGMTIRADKSRLVQVFENLYRNSVEHSSTGSRGAPDDSVEHGSADSRPRADDAAEHGGPAVTVTVGELDDGFYVADDGPGIPPADRDSVFDVGVTTTAEGIGLGLSIVREIVEAHGWSIEVTSGAEGGARFEITGVERVED